MLEDGEKPPEAIGKAVSVEYASGLIAQGYGYDICWTGAKRWRFGWAPRR